MAGRLLVNSNPVRCRSGWSCSFQQAISMEPSAACCSVCSRALDAHVSRSTQCLIIAVTLGRIKERDVAATEPLGAINCPAKQLSKAVYVAARWCYTIASEGSIANRASFLKIASIDPAVRIVTAARSHWMMALHCVLQFALQMVRNSNSHRHWFKTGTLSGRDTNCSSATIK